jgi:NAD-specific glutamate dehydrogenase
VDLVGGDASAGTTRQFVLQKTRQQQESSSPGMMAVAESYAKLIEDLKERERLLRLDTGAENQLTPKEMSRRAAARSGLLLPDLDPELSK